MDWQQFLDEFRSFGGVAENIIQRHGEIGLGIFPIDPQEPLEIKVPEHLLVPADNVDLRDGAVVIKDHSRFPMGYPDWFQRYQALYSWGADGEASVTRFEQGLLDLPETVLKALQQHGLYNQAERLTGTSFQLSMLQQFLKSRCVGRRGRLLVMPIVELINHYSNANGWTDGRDGSIGVKGAYTTEVLVRYSYTDPLRRLMTYGFNSAEPMAFSLPLRVVHRGKEVIISGRGGGKWFSPPKMKLKNSKLVINKPLLGYQRMPKLPKTLFLKACEAEYHIHGAELFDQIRHANTAAIIDLLRVLKHQADPVANQLMQGCLDQLDALSQQIGQGRNGAIRPH
uniref:hypothetical protein n=1 Tax=Synechococcus sp. UW106 TaxID=368495 RepID=UPI000E0F0E5E|nr:hypothetical protein [Synechococcus sp. UW106]